MRQTSLILFLFVSFRCKNSDSVVHIESEPIHLHNLKAKQGNCYAFKDSSGKYFTSVVMNFNKSEGQIWYAMCLNDFYSDSLPAQASINSIRFLGRKVAYYEPGNYKIGINVTWVPDTTIENNKSATIGKIDLQSAESVEIVGESSVHNYKNFLLDYYFTKTEILTLPDKYDDFSKLHLRSDEYFTLKQIIDSNRLREKSSIK